WMRALATAEPLRLPRAHPRLPGRLGGGAQWHKRAVLHRARRFCDGRRREALRLGVEHPFKCRWAAPRPSGWEPVARHYIPRPETSHSRDQGHRAVELARPRGEEARLTGHVD